MNLRTANALPFAQQPVNSLLLSYLCTSSRPINHWQTLLACCPQGPTMFKAYWTQELPRGSEAYPNNSVQGHKVRPCPQWLQPPTKELSSFMYSFNSFNRSSGDIVFFPDMPAQQANHLRHCSIGSRTHQLMGSWGCQSVPSYAIAIRPESLASILSYPILEPAFSLLIPSPL